MRIKNFRGFTEEACIDFHDLSVLIGKNDSGKSTILEALNAFFNDSIEKDDFCVYASEGEKIIISCIFSDLPEKIILDSTYETKLSDEFLVNKEGKLEIVKEFDCSPAKPKTKKMYLNSYAPSAESINDLYELKITDLKNKAKTLNIDISGINKSVCSEIRHAIWNQSDDLLLSEQHIDLNGFYGKSIYPQIKDELPIFALFKSDRTSTDQDSEAQDPMKAAIKETIAQYSQKLEELQKKVEDDLSLIASRTIEKIKEMEPTLANELNPQVKHKNWESLFAVSLTGDDQIPINKRGSGTRRLILLNFFRAKAEQISESQKTGIIYAIEEPETSQHPDHQKILIDAFQELTLQGNCQVILTTHTPNLIRRIDQKDILFIENVNHKITITKAENEKILNEIQKSLGILPDHNIKAFLGLEGKNDINYFRTISKVLSQSEPDIVDFELAENLGNLVFIPMGGSSLELWISKLSGLNRPEFYITDRDNQPPAKAHYQREMDSFNALDNCSAYITSKRELENYINIKAIQQHKLDFPSQSFSDFSDIPLIYAKYQYDKAEKEKSWEELSDSCKKKKINNAKRILNKQCVAKMTPELLTEVDKKDEIRKWLRIISASLKEKK